MFENCIFGWLGLPFVLERFDLVIAFKIYSIYALHFELFRNRKCHLHFCVSSNISKDCRYETTTNNKYTTTKNQQQKIKTTKTK
jgi:hypothetical protein